MTLQGVGGWSIVKALSTIEARIRRPRRHGDSLADTARAQQGERGPVAQGRANHCARYSDLEIETAIIALRHEPGGGLVVMTGSFTIAHRASIISAAARNNVLAVYTISLFARNGGLLSYGLDPLDIIRRAASYVDRILRGAKQGDDGTSRSTVKWC
jgi:hypothetical protein